MKIVIMASSTVDEGSKSIGGDASTLRDASPTDKRPGDEVVVLEISAETVVRPPSSFDEVEFRDGSTNLRRDRPFSASVISRQSVRSTQSRASLSPTLITSDYAAKNLFAYRVRRRRPHLQSIWTWLKEDLSSAFIVL